jgi:hypothetical protein
MDLRFPFRSISGQQGKKSIVSLMVSSKQCCWFQPSELLNTATDVGGIDYLLWVRNLLGEVGSERERKGSTVGPRLNGCWRAEKQSGEGASVTQA